MVFFLWMMSFFKIVNPGTGMTQAFPEPEDLAMTRYIDSSFFYQFLKLKEDGIIGTLY